MATANRAVSIPAPALSAVVIAFKVEVLSVESVVPAVGSLVLFPPVRDVTGAYELAFVVMIRFDQKIFNALICSSSPIWPSQLFVYHFTPHVLLLSPEQDAAAAALDVCSFGTIVLYVEGTIKAVKAIQPAVSPLKRTSLRLQISVVSHSNSVRMLP